MDDLARELFLDIGGIGSRVSVETHEIEAPRIALYKSWTAAIDEGWTRWLLEQFEFPYTNVSDSEVKAGELSKKFDVLIIPSMDTESIVQGLEEGTISPKYVGGLGTSGVNSIGKFVEEGGTLIALSQASLFALDTMGLPVSDALAGLRPPDRRSRSMESPKAADVRFACPGSVLRMSFDARHPVAYGMPKEAPAMFYQGTAFDILPTFSAGGAPRVISKYPGDKLLLSGYLKGEEHIANKAAAADVPLGKGRVILLGFGVKQRAQPHGTFKLLFNSLFYTANN